MTQLADAPASVRPAGSMPKGGRWNWYQEGPDGREWQPMTSILKHIETDTYNLDAWKRRQVLVGAARRPDVIIGAQAIGLPGPDGFTSDQKRDLDRLVRDAENAAKVTDGANLGNAMHRATERIDRGEPLSAINFPEPYASSLRAYAQLRELNGWQSVEIERTVRVTELDVAGTFDRVDEIPGLADRLGPCCAEHGPTDAVIDDVKTEASPLLNLIHIVSQLAGYAHGDAMWIPGQGWSEMPVVRCDVAVMVHVRDGAAVPYLLNLRAGWEAVRAAAAQRDRLKASKIEPGRPGAWAVPLPHQAPPARPAEGIVQAAAARDPQVLASAARTLGLDEPPRTELGAPPVDDVVRIVLDNIGAANSRDDLALAFERAGMAGIPWAGFIERAGARRLAIVECAQRQLHTGSGYCACGWSAADGDRP